MHEIDIDIHTIRRFGWALGNSTLELDAVSAAAEMPAEECLETLVRLRSAGLVLGPVDIDDLHEAWALTDEGYRRWALSREMTESEVRECLALLPPGWAWDGALYALRHPASDQIRLYMWSIHRWSCRHTRKSAFSARRMEVDHVLAPTRGECIRDLRRRCEPLVGDLRRRCEPLVGDTSSPLKAIAETLQHGRHVTVWEAEGVRYTVTLEAVTAK